jgi:hypothetical protein
MPGRYELIVRMAPSDLDDLGRRGERVAIAKPQANAAPSIIWIACAPGLRNVIGWNETRYGLYAARAESGPSDAFRLVDDAFPATPRARYTFDGRALRRSRTLRDLPRDRYVVVNESAHPLTSGLTQAARVNGVVMRSRLNAVNVASGEGAQFAAATRLYVWLQRGAENGAVAVLSPFQLSACAIEAKPGTVSLVYDRTSALFVPAPPRTRQPAR